MRPRTPESLNPVETSPVMTTELGNCQKTGSHQQVTRKKHLSRERSAARCWAARPRSLIRGGAPVSWHLLRNTPVVTSTSNRFRSINVLWAPWEMLPASHSANTRYLTSCFCKDFVFFSCISLYILTSAHADVKFYLFNIVIIRLHAPP